jgi:ribonuclease J
MTDLSFYGGVGEIGGNKILVQDRDARVWMDMGSTFHVGDDFFVQYLLPRDRFGLRDYFALGLLPRLPGLYSEDWLDRADLPHEPPRFSAVFISHIHFDHTNHLRFLDPGIPVHLGVGTKIILDSWEITTRGMDLLAHDYRTFRTGSSVDADGIEVEPIHVDHSAPAAYGFLVHTTEGTVAYTGYLRQHGPHAEMTRDFIEAARANEPIALITEGTRVTPDDPRANLSEAAVKSKSIETAGRAKGKAVFATFYPRDVDRIRTFVEVAQAVDRQFVIQARAAHLLVSLSQDTRIQVPDVLRDPNLLVYDRRFERQDTWEKNLFAQLGDRVVTSDYVRDHQAELVVQLDFTTMPELIDIQPVPGSAFIHSKSEPIEEDDEVEEAVANWVRFFKLRRYQYHASGHMSEHEIAEMIKAIAPKVVIPVHTEHPERFVRFAPRVVQPTVGQPVPLG